MKIQRTCQILECGRKHFGQGYCNRHWKKWKKYGDPLIGATRRDYAFHDTIESAFNAYISKPKNEDECWEWQGYIDPVSGYGQFTYQRKHYSAHRVSYYLTHGKWAYPMTLHSCDNRLCWNPHHLRAGTNAQNMEDKVSRNRQLKGEDIASAKLNAGKVQAIRASIKNQADLAREFGVTEAQIHRVKHRKQWKHI